MLRHKVVKPEDVNKYMADEDGTWPTFLVDKIEFDGRVLLQFDLPEKVAALGDLPPYQFETCPVCLKACRNMTRGGPHSRLLCEDGHSWHWVPVFDVTKFDDDPRPHRRLSHYIVQVLEA